MGDTTRRRLVKVVHETAGYNGRTRRVYELGVDGGKVRLKQTDPSSEKLIRFEMEFDEWREMVRWIDEDIDRATMESLANIGETE